MRRTCLILFVTRTLCPGTSLGEFLTSLEQRSVYYSYERSLNVTLRSKARSNNLRLSLSLYSPD